MDIDPRYLPIDPELIEMELARRRRRTILAVIAIIVVVAMVALFAFSDWWQASRRSGPPETTVPVIEAVIPIP